MTERIVDLAKTLGQVADEDEAALRVLCALAEEELSRRLRPGVTAQDCEAAFSVGAAWLALAGLCAGEREESVTAGGLSIKRSGASGPERSAELRRQCERVMAPYLRDEAFFFLGVRG